jgi:pimeloyl-ACP methyl ester carboxylesterase
MASIALVIIAGLLSLNGLMYLQQPSMIFYPMSEMSRSPADWGLEYEDVTLTTDDMVKLHGWFIPNRNSSKVLLFFHGNAGNISHRGDSIALFHRLGLNVLIIDYRGYGKSQGTPSEQGLYLDAGAAWRYLTEEKKFTPDRVLIFGRSLGGAVAARLASEVRARGVMLESTFSSARDFANAAFPGLARVLYVRYDFATEKNLKKIDYPVLVLHSPDDEIMPFSLGQKVYAAANDPKHFIEMKGDHNYGFIQSQPDYEREMGKWIAGIKD